ncbi:hypothetical protein AURDEDRAFT_115802 [Auricularia subglabra TFB-10046 SS5]|nr:hypothetical protein AURDEDRAFT_115802 [Auricularia subglabra TFB-10046 SS5]
MPVPAAATFVSPSRSNARLLPPPRRRPNGLPLRRANQAYVIATAPRGRTRFQNRVRSGRRVASARACNLRNTVVLTQHSRAPEKLA